MMDISNIKLSLLCCMDKDCWHCPYRLYKNDIDNCLWHLHNDLLYLVEKEEQRINEYEEYRKKI